MPIVHDIRVTCADCGPARIACTGRLPAVALDAINTWQPMALVRKIGPAFATLQMDCSAPEKREPPRDIRDIIAQPLIRNDDAMAAS